MKIRLMNELFCDIPESKAWRKIEFLDKGWSADKKYLIQTDVDRKLVIRLADISQYRSKTAEYQAMLIIYKLGIEMSQPIDFGTCAGGQKVYTLVSWLEGQSADEALPLLSCEDQNTLGTAAGKILRKIHSISAPESRPDWENLILTKIKNKTTRYLSCGFSVPHEDKLKSFIKHNLRYLKSRPQTLQHGDFHPGNFILSSFKTLGVIDFNRTDYGDPWEEFVRVSEFTKDISADFAAAQIKGYFNNSVPELFFQLLALYSAINAYFSIIWAIPFGNAEIEKTLNRSKRIYRSGTVKQRFIQLLKT